MEHYQLKIAQSFIVNEKSNTIQVNQWFVYAIVTTLDMKVLITLKLVHD